MRSREPCRAATARVAGRRAQQPQQHGHVVERVAQRADHVGVADPALGAGRLDRRPPRLGARHRAHRVALGEQPAREVQAAAAAADDERPHAGGSRGSPPRARPRVPRRSAATGSCSSSSVSSGSPRPAPALVDRLAHLVEVVDLVLGLDLGRAGRPPVELLGPGAGVEGAEEQISMHEQERDAEHDDGDRDPPSASLRRRGLAASPAAIFAEHCRRGELAYQVDGDGRAVFQPRLGPARDWRVAALGGERRARDGLRHDRVRRRDEPLRRLARRPRRGLSDDEPRRGLAAEACASACACACAFEDGCRCSSRAADRA